MMRQRNYSLIGLLLVLIAGLGLSWFQPGIVQAEILQYPTDEQAFLAILGDYMTITGETSDWRIGEIRRSGKFAVTIAQAGEDVSEYQDFLLLMARQDETGEWLAVSPEVVGEQVYNQWLADMPEDLVNGFEKSYYYLYEETAISAFSYRAVPLHHFPWAITREAVLTQKDGSYHTHQLDFVMRSINDIYASKPGLVIFVKDSSGVGGCDIDLWPWANMVVVQHSATEYTWYVHLKQGSATVNVGDLIGYGTKIGEQGNTGFACGTTGIHLHYMASNAIPSGWPDPNVPNYAPWPPSGTIYPIDFIESSYAALVVGDTYVSQNASPPGVCNTSPTEVNFYDNTYCNSHLRSTSVAGLQNLFLLGLDARVESIEIPQGWSVTLYLDKNELGSKVCLNGSDSMLWDNLFSNGERVANNVVWARVYKVPNCPYPFTRGIALYPQTNFGGIPLWGTYAAIGSNEPGYPVGSVFVGDGYSAKIFDLDYQAGNSVCLSGSALDLSQVSGWPGGNVESVKLMIGDQCDPAPPDVPTPVLVKPADNGTAYQENAEVCWQMTGTGYSFNVQILSDSGFNVTSGWIGAKCWTSPDLAERTGIYTWRVQARNSDLELGDWSEPLQFTLLDDTNPPSASFANLQEGDEVVRPRKQLSVVAEDLETGVSRVYFLAWYDDGSGEGYDWRDLGVDEDGSNGWQVVWNLLPVISPDAVVWATVEDLGGNFTNVQISNLAVVDMATNGGGNSYKTGNGNGEIPVAPPVIPGQPAGTDPGGTDQPVDPAPLATPPDPSGNDVPAAPVEQPVVVVMPEPPVVVTPVFNETFYLPEEIQLCWETAQVGFFEYQVELIGLKTSASPWLVGTCWQPTGLDSGSGEYAWRVRGREVGVGDSNWSANGAFTLALDEIDPTVAFLSPREEEGLGSEVLIQLKAIDQESGLQMAQVLAWYDAGDGAKWHELSKESVSENEFQVIWDIAGLPAQKAQLWVYVTDRAGNLGSAMVPDLQLGKVPVNPVNVSRYHKSLVDVMDNSRDQ